MMDQKSMPETHLDFDLMQAFLSLCLCPQLPRHPPRCLRQAGERGPENARNETYVTPIWGTAFFPGVHRGLRTEGLKYLMMSERTEERASFEAVARPAGGDP